MSESPRALDVVGIGSAIVDVIARADEAFLEAHGMVKGSMTLIERKAGDANTCVEYLKAKRLLNNVVVQSFDWNYVTDCHELAPELTLAALGRDEITGKRLDAVEATGARIAAWHEASLSTESIV